VLFRSPQFIKAAVVSRALASMAAGANEILLHTGQHYDDNMSEIFFRELGIPKPVYTLGIGSGTHAYQTGEMLKRIGDILLTEKPTLVMVYGDTNSTLAGALAAAKLDIPVVHIEAGLRSFNRKMPEEINRVMTDHLSSILFAPTETAVENLLCEGIAREHIHLVGDVMYDAALYYGELAENKSTILKQLDVKPKKYILATLHRAENTDNVARLTTIVEAFINVARKFDIVFSVHPRTQLALKNNGLWEEIEKTVKIISPVGYFDMVTLEKNAAVVVTDSGGVQKEAYFYRVPCVTLRDETEWVELVDSGWNVLASPAVSGSDVLSQIILNSIGHTGEEIKLYGDGAATSHILNTLLMLPMKKGKYE
jgi:UDP-GlcNAc3NAcA epimerase